MLQKTFEIHQGKIPTGTLHFETGLEHIVLTALDDNNITSHNFEFYSFDANDDFENVLSQIYAQSSFLKHDYQQVKIIWENNRTQYVPAVFYNEKMENVLYDFAEKSLRPQKRLSKQNDIFAIPFSVDQDRYNLLHKAFLNAEDTHKYYEIIQQPFTSSGNNALDLLVIFYPQHFIIAANKNEQLQFINSISFSSGTDVVYYLLNTAKQLGASASDTLLRLSGLIDGDSNLFKEIYKYMPHIDVDTADNATFLRENFSEYPSHFFVPFFKYA